MNRHDFVFLFDATDANPNGDPDAGNLPRLDPETGHGLVTDVCLKRKIRNYVALVKKNKSPHRIYFTDGAVLKELKEEAYAAAGVKPVAKKLPKDAAKAREVTAFMCRNFYDIRTFGAVMSMEVNCGQVRGPVQMSFARSTDPIVTLEHAITRSSVEKRGEGEDEESGAARTMGRKFTIPYGLYRAHGFINPFLAEQTGFGDDDLALFWQALESAFQFDQSAARPAGSMAARRLIVFEHGSQLGNAPSHALLEAVSVRRRDGVEAPRSFADYEVSVKRDRIPERVTVHERI